MVSSENQRSTRLIHELDVRREVQHEPGVLSEPQIDSGGGVGSARSGAQNSTTPSTTDRSSSAVLITTRRRS